MHNRITRRNTLKKDANNNNTQKIVKKTQENSSLSYSTPNPKDIHPGSSKRVATSPIFKDNLIMADYTTKDDLQQIHTSLLAAIHELNSSIDTKLNNFKTNMESIKKMEESQQFLSDEFETFKNSLQDNNSKIDTFEKTVCTFQSSVTQISSNYEILRSDVNSIQQNLLFNNILIANIPHSSPENLPSIVSKICEKLEVPIQPMDIVSTMRTLSKNRLNIQPILVQFSNIVVKNMVMEKAKSVHIECKDIGLNADFRIHIHHQLTASNQELLAKTRTFKRKYQYQFAWYSRGSIYLKKTPESPAFRILSSGSLEKLELQICNGKKNSSSSKT